MKRFLKITGIILVVLTTLLLVLYYYIVSNADNILQDLVTSQSNGKLSLEIKKVKFKAASLHLEVIEPHFYSNDTLTALTTYDIKAKEFVLEITAIMPLIFQRKIVLDTISCRSPQIVVTKRKDQPKDQPKEDFSLPEQMGKAYTDLENVLKKLNIKYCLVDSGSFSLVNKLMKDPKPIAITDFHLRIDNLTLDSTSKTDSRNRFADRIKFHSSNQDIGSADGNNGIRYRKLSINSGSQAIELDSCYIYRKKSGSGFNEFDVFFDTLRITGADFKKITQSGIIKADSAVCINPEIRVNIEKPENSNGKIEKPQNSNSKKTKKPLLSEDSMEIVIKALLADIDIHYIGVENANVNIKTKSKDKISTFSSERIDFNIQEITILKDTAIPVKFGSLSMAVYGYQTYNPDSTYLLSFDSIHFKDRKINLSNFSITPTAKNKNFTNRKKIGMRALEIEYLSWLNLLLNKKIVAREITMIGPEISIIAPEKKSASTKLKRPSIFEIFRSMDDLVEVDRLKIEDANIDFYTGGKSHLRLIKVNCDIGLREFLHSDNMHDLSGSVKLISFDHGTLHNGKNTILLQNGLFNGVDQTLTIRRASLALSGGSGSATLEDIRAEKFLNEGDGQFEIENLSWRKANIEIQPSNIKNKNGGKTATKKNPLQIALNKLDGRNTAISFKSGGIDASVMIDRLQTNRIYWDGKNKPDIAGLQINGNSLHLKKSTLDFFAREFMIGDQQSSYLKQLKIISTGKKDEVSIISPGLFFTPNIASILNGSPVIGNVILNEPEISFSGTGTGDTSKSPPAQKKGKLPKLEINQVSILNPLIASLPSSLQNNFKVGKQESSLQITGIKSDGNNLTIAGFNTAMSSFSAATNKLSVSVPGDGKLAIDVSDISYSPATGESPATWSVTLDSLSARNVAITTKRNDSTKNEILLQSLDAENLKWESGEKLGFNGMLAKSKNFRVNNGTVYMVNAKNDVRIKSLAYDNFQQRLSFDSFSVKPVMDRDSFNRMNNLAKDYIEFATGKTQVEGIDPELYFKDSVFYARKIQSSWTILHLYKDKRLPGRPATYRDLPVSRIRQWKKKIHIDSIYLLNADITYEELNDKTNMIGIVQFKRMNALVEGIKTFNYNPTDSFRIRATTWFMDSAFLRFRFSESYEDTLHAFLMHLRLSPFNMPALNPLLGPLVSLNIKNGWLDTMHMSAIGREYVSLGKMRMYYSGLKAQYLNKGNAEDKTMKTRLINFAANNLILKNKNKKGYGKVYSERKLEKNIFNYWIKMVVSGVISSTGVKSNKKQEKKYYKSIRKLKVPEVPEAEL